MHSTPAFSSVAFEPHLLRAHRLFESHDLDDTRERISRVMQPHRLKPLGHSQGGRSHMDFMQLGGIGLGTIDFGAAMRVDVEQVEDYHLLMFCLRGRAEVLAGRHTLRADTRRGLICAPGTRFLADLSPDCEQFVLRLDRRMVEAHAGGPVRFDTPLDLGRPRLRAWLDQLQLLFSSQPLMEVIQSAPLVAAEMERLLVRLLLAAQATDAGAGAGAGAGAEADVDTRAGGEATRALARAWPCARESHVHPHTVCVRRAEDYMQMRVDEPLRLGDIADAAGVSVRTLLDAFRRVRQCSPMQTLRDMRLDAAHRRLRDPDAHTTVAVVALDCGFGHLSRFAQAYRQRFGESPSATLRAGG